MRQMKNTYKTIRAGMIRAERRVLAMIKSENKMDFLYSSGNYARLGIPTSSTFSAVSRLEKKGLIKFVPPTKRNQFHGGFKAVNA
jgi:DNA-binding MarR family transcriptional regulator